MQSHHHFFQCAAKSFSKLSARVPQSSSLHTGVMQVKLFHEGGQVSHQGTGVGRRSLQNRFGDVFEVLISLEISYMTSSKLFGII